MDPRSLNFFQINSANKDSIRWDQKTHFYPLFSSVVQPALPFQIALIQNQGQSFILMRTTIIMMVVVTMVLVLTVIKHIYSWQYCLLKKKKTTRKTQNQQKTKPNLYSLSSILTELAHVGTSWVCIRYWSLFNCMYLVVLLGFFFPSVKEKLILTVLNLLIQTICHKASLHMVQHHLIFTGCCFSKHYSKSFICPKCNRLGWASE